MEGRRILTASRQGADHAVDGGGNGDCSGPSLLRRSGRVTRRPYYLLQYIDHRAFKEAMKKSRRVDDQPSRARTNNTTSVGQQGAVSSEQEQEQENSLELLRSFQTGADAMARKIAEGYGVMKKEVEELKKKNDALREERDALKAKLSGLTLERIRACESENGPVLWWWRCTR